MIQNEEFGESYIRASRRFINMVELESQFITHDKSRKSLQKKHPEAIFIKSWRELSNILAHNETALRSLLKQNYKERRDLERLE